jgi:hypothetical protein
VIVVHIEPEPSAQEAAAIEAALAQLDRRRLTTGSKWAAGRSESTSEGASRYIATIQPIRSRRRPSP